MILQGETTNTPALSKTTFGQASVPPGDMGLPPYRDDDSSSPLAPQAYVPAPRPESAGKRFIKALACGVLAYLVLAVVVKGTVMLATGRYDYGVPVSALLYGTGTVRSPRNSLHCISLATTRTAFANGSLFPGLRTSGTGRRDSEGVRRETGRLDLHSIQRQLLPCAHVFQSLGPIT